jgi:predicted O-linked N-acetylglucosamine transferase (SPINDLY family)
MSTTAPPSPPCSAKEHARLLRQLQSGYEALDKGKPESALDVFLAIAESAPWLAASWHGLGLASHESGNHTDSLRFLRQACSLSPQTGVYWRDLARVLLAGREPEAALQAADRALGSDEKDALAHFLRAQALADLRRFPESIDAYGVVLALEPGSPMALNNLGNIMRALGQHSEAKELYRMALRSDPAYVEAWHNLGAIHALSQEWPEAASCEAEALRRKPDFWQAFLGLGMALTQQKQFAEARICLERALALAGENPDVLIELGNLAISEHRGEDALRYYVRAANADPNYAGALINAGNLLRINGAHAEALALAERVIALHPAHAGAHNLAGNCLGDLGRMRDALAAFQKAVEQNPADSVAFSNLLYNLNFHSAFSREHVAALHLAWGRSMEARVASSRIAPRTPLRAGKRLRVGYVSGDFRRHSVMYFLGPILRRHDRARFEVFCYSNLDREDSLTRQIRKMDLLWRDITALTDEAACRQIVDDQIDLLVDLSGHTGGNRLGIFARKPAPLQITYLGYPNTTGLAGIDYRIVDAITDPVSGDGAQDPGALYAERLARLPGSFLCFSPPGESLEPAGAAHPGDPSIHVFSIPVLPGTPESRRGFLTFGTFNNSKKIDVEAAMVWGEAMRAIPGCRLLLKGKAYQNALAREQLFVILRQGGIRPEQVELRGDAPSLVDHLAQYNDIDIALDTFPYNGTTTTCEALWMGVPVITLAGSAHASRVGASLLHAVGHPEWVAESPSAFVAACCSLAADPKRREELRQQLRAELLQSPLMDEVGFVGRLESFYQQAWEDLCRRASVEL